jgi:uncharacterized protein (DUF1684 family)
MFLYQIPRRCFLILLIVSLQTGYSQEKSAYEASIQSWQLERDHYLISPEGWVNLSGLFWLKPGKNSFGSDPKNDIVFANNNFPNTAGYFLLTDGKVEWFSSPGILIHRKEKNMHDAIIFEEGIPPVILETGSFLWNIIKREDKYGVRLRDLLSPAIHKFKSVPRFPINESWRVIAHLTPPKSAGLTITNILGQTKMENSPGMLLFSIEGKQYQLDALEEGNELFILFGDATSGKTTYSTGRYLYASKPDENGNTILDFNKAFNPPCAFTTFATCPLPPKQNMLPIAITAGEKDVENH